MGTLQLENMPTVQLGQLAVCEGALEALLEMATARCGELFVGNEQEEAESLAEAIRGGRKIMRILHELTDEIGSK